MPRIISRLKTWVAGSMDHPRFLLFCSRSSIRAGLYYTFRNAFTKEHQSVLAGRAAFADRSGANDYRLFYTLRRNTHRLEKGLIMRPRRGHFALDYIGETVGCYVDACGRWSKSPCPQESTLRWARDVLKDYFGAVQSHPVVDRAKARFEAVTYPEDGSQAAGWKPFVRAEATHGIKVEQMQMLALHRRSVRWYQQKPVPREIIDRAIDVARYSPSACNRQPFEFRIFDDPELIRQIATIPGGTAGFAHNFPCVMVVVGDVGAFPVEPDRHVIYIDASLAVMACLFALEVQGVSSCVINWRETLPEERKMARALNLAAHQRVICLVSLGYAQPEAMVPFSQKKPLEQVRSYNNVGH